MVLPPCHHCNPLQSKLRFFKNNEVWKRTSILWTNCKTHFPSAGTDFFEVFCARPNTFAVGFWYWRPNSCSPFSFFRCFLLWCCTLDPIGQCEPGWWLGLLGCDTDCCWCHGRVNRWNGWRYFQASGHRPHDQWHTPPPLLHAPKFAWWWVA